MCKGLQSKRSLGPRNDGHKLIAVFLDKVGIETAMKGRKNSIKANGGKTKFKAPKARGHGHWRDRFGAGIGT